MFTGTHSSKGSLISSLEPRVHNPAAPGNRGGGELRGLLKSTSTTLSSRPITYRCVASCMTNSSCSAFPESFNALEIPSCWHHRVDGKRDCGAERVGIFHRSPVYPNSSAPPLCRRIELTAPCGRARSSGAASMAQASDAQDAKIARFSFNVKSGSLTTSNG